MLGRLYPQVLLVIAALKLVEKLLAMATTSATVLHYYCMIANVSTYLDSTKKIIHYNISVLQNAERNCHNGFINMDL